MKRKHTALSILTILLVILGSNLNTQISEAKYTLSPTDNKSLNIIPEKEDEAVIPAQIIIPDLGLDLPVEEGHIENGTWTLNDHSALYAQGSTSLNTEHGNTIVYAHAREGLFKHLRSLKKGSKIRVIGSDGQEYLYKVIEGEVIKPEEIKKIMKIGKHNLTLFTCDGPDDKYRLLIRARKIIN